MSDAFPGWPEESTAGTLYDWAGRPVSPYRGYMPGYSEAEATAQKPAKRPKTPQPLPKPELHYVTDTWTRFPDDPYGIDRYTARGKPRSVLNAARAVLRPELKADGQTFRMWFERMMCSRCNGNGSPDVYANNPKDCKWCEGTGLA